jgi:hypothetical protein
MEVRILMLISPAGYGDRILATYCYWARKITTVATGNRSD